MVDRQRLLVKTAQLYYQQELTQAEISSRLNLSRQKVQRLLQDARNQGIVKISVQPLIGVYSELEQGLEERYGLREAIVVETTAYEEQEIVTREVGAGAADYLVRVIQPNSVIVISWGGSLLGMVEALWSSRQTGHLPGIKVVQGLGGLGDPTNETHAADLTRRLAKIVGGQAILLPAPGVAGSPAISLAFSKDPFVAATLKQAAAADLAFMGIGAPRRDSILMREGSIVQWQELQELLLKNAVGDINLRYFDGSGRIIRSDLNDRVIGLGLDEIRDICTVVGVAGGEAKLEAIRGAVRGNFINILVTDHITADRLLSW